jgi:hypothetical protein
LPPPTAEQRQSGGKTEMRQGQIAVCLGAAVIIIVFFLMQLRLR